MSGNLTWRRSSRHDLALRREASGGLHRSTRLEQFRLFKPSSLISSASPLQEKVSEARAAPEACCENYERIDWSESSVNVGVEVYIVKVLDNQPSTEEEHDAVLEQRGQESSLVDPHSCRLLARPAQQIFYVPPAIALPGLGLLSLNPQ